MDRGLAALEGDPVVGAFFGPDFDAEEFARAIMRQDIVPSNIEETAAEAAMRSIRAASAEVDAAIKALVTTHQEELLAQAGTTVALKHEVSGASTRVGDLVRTAGRLKEDIVAPLADLRRDAAVLRGVCATTDLLRQAQRFLLLVRRLKALVRGSGSGGSGSTSSTGTTTASGSAAPTVAALTAALQADPRLLARVAPLVTEAADHLDHHSPALARIAAVAAEAPFVDALADAARAAASAAFRRAVDTLNAADVGALLQVLADLHCLPVVVTDTMTAIGAGAVTAIREALDVRLIAAAAQAAIEGGAGSHASPSLASATSGGHGGAAAAAVGPAAAVAVFSVSPAAAAAAVSAFTPAPGAAAAWRGVLWGRVEGMAEALQRAVLQAWNLCYVLAQRRDASAGGGGGGGAVGSASGGRGQPLALQVLAAMAAVALRDGLPTSAAAAATASVDAPVVVTVGEGGSLDVAAANGGGAPTADGHPTAAAAATASSFSSSSSSSSAPAQQHPCVVLLRRFWTRVTTTFREEVTALASADLNALVRNTLADGYVRLHYLLLEATGKAARSVALRSGGGGDEAAAPLAGDLRVPLASGGSGGSSGTATTTAAVVVVRARLPPITGGALLSWCIDPRRLVWSASPLLRLYLARSLGRMTEALAAMFPPHAGAAGAGMGGGGGRGLPAPSASGAAAGDGLSPLFTPAAEFARAMAERPPCEAPTSAATAAFVKCIAIELGACRPGAPAPASSAAAAAGMAGGGSSGGGSSASVAGLPADPSLYASVAKGVSTALKLLVAKVDGLIAPDAPAAVAVADHYMPTPLQLFHLALVCRLDDVRRGILRMAADAPLPQLLAHVVATSNAADVDDEAGAWLHHPLPPALRAVAGAIALPPPSSSTGGAQAVHATALADAVAQTAHGQLLRALAALDACVDNVLLPWTAGVGAPLERTLLKLHDSVYTGDAPSAAAGGAGKAASAGVDASDAPAATAAAAPAPPPPESTFVSYLRAYAEALATHQLPKLPSGHVSLTVRGALASRLLGLFVRHACLLQGLSEPGNAYGRSRLARDAAGVVRVAATLMPDESRILRAVQRVDALSAFIGCAPAGGSAVAAAAGDAVAAAAATVAPAAGACASARLLELVTSSTAATASDGEVRTTLRSLGAANVLHGLLSRLPAALCTTPYAALDVSPQEYSAMLDAKAIAGACDALTTGGSSGGGGGGGGGGVGARVAVVQHEAARFYLQQQQRRPAAGDAATAAFVLAEVQRCAGVLADRVTAVRAKHHLDGAGGAAGGGGSPADHAEYVLLVDHAPRVVALCS